MKDKKADRTSKQVLYICIISAVLVHILSTDFKSTALQYKKPAL